ncbi:CHAD domain-containing protein [Nocardia sp. NBC_01388]|uniref:CHAD domain-containing protein n=1 Tax=Nocardia sp. NBC_01388 TaxID=2903596 RepID=UPI0032482725
MNTTAGPALVDALAADVDRLRVAEPEVRQDLPDSVHQMRVATRRLRSLLRSYRPAFARGPVTELSDELRWLAGLLGVARDAEVRADQFEALLGANGALFDDGSAADGGFAADGKKSADKKTAAPTASKKTAAAAASKKSAAAAAGKKPAAAGKRPSSANGSGKAARATVKSTAIVDFGTQLVAEEREKYAAAHKIAVQAFDTPRYRTLLDNLSALLADPPLRGKAGKPAADLFTDVLHHDFAALRDLVRTEPNITGNEHIEHLHDIRKAAKRLRYSAEAATAVLGDPAADLARNAKKLQTVLGDHRDAVEGLETLHTHASAEQEPGYQRLRAAEEAAAAQALDQYPATTAFLDHHAL